jgi:hypothetical protein
LGGRDIEMHQGLRIEMEAAYPKLWCGDMS